MLGVVHCVQAFLPAMRAAGGERKIVNVASATGVAPGPNMSAYAASKHAVIGLSEVLALELCDSPISVLVVCPGYINTSIVRSPGASAPGISEAQIEKLRRYYVENGCLPWMERRRQARIGQFADPHGQVAAFVHDVASVPFARPGRPVEVLSGADAVSCASDAIRFVRWIVL